METSVTTPIIVSKVQDNGWQYKLTAKIDYISPTYEVNSLSLDKKLTGNIPTEGQTYLCTLERGNLRKFQDGRDKDDTKTWNFFWNIVEFDIQQSDLASSPYKVETVAPKTASQPFNTQTDINPTTRLNITASNVRTALMQSVEMGKADGIVADTLDIILERADELLKYQNDRIFGSSPLVAKAIEEGATVSSIRPIEESPVTQQDKPSAEMYAQLKQNWNIPDRIADGREMKDVLVACGFEMEWVMGKFQEIGISKSADYVSSERGSYQDLVIILCSKAVTEGKQNPNSSNDDIW